MTKKEIKDQISYYQKNLNQAIQNNNWSVVKDSASHISDLSFLIISGQEDYDNFKIVEAVNNSASLHQAECPVCGKPFTRPDEEGTHICLKCSSRVHYRAFTSREISDSITDDGNPDCEVIS